MHHPIIFSTPSPFDLRSLTIMGINAKPASGGTPIGYFGTGLKYAVAVLKREGCEVAFRTPEASLEVISRKTDFRGKAFEELSLWNPATGDAIPLPFTTELGKDWTPLMAYRELVTNTRDEGGTIYDGPEARPPASLEISVSGEAIRSARSQHSKMFLDSPEIIETLGMVQICEPHPEGGVFYRGMKVLDLPPGASAFTYNFTSGVSLTEDRAAKIYHLPYFLAEAIWQTQNPRVISEIISGTLLEAKTEYHDSSMMSLALANAILDLSDEGRIVRSALLTMAYKRLGRAPKRRTLAITGSRERTLHTALSILREHGFTLSPDRIHLMESADYIGLADKLTGEIFLTTETFRKGLPCVVGTLYEEYLHQRYHLTDETREMQNHILDDFATLMVDLHLARSGRSGGPE